MNAKQEFIERTAGLIVICAFLEQADAWTGKPHWKHCFKKGHTKEEYEDFLKKINFNYDSGYGGQEVEGIIWCENDIWFTRGEYDGSEWWEEHRIPKIPPDLL